MIQPAPQPVRSTAAGNDDTRPLPVVPADPSPQRRAKAVGDLESALLVRAGLCLLATVALLVVAVILFRLGEQTNPINGFEVVRYLGPWIAGGFGVALVAALLFTRGVVDLTRWIRVRRRLRRTAGAGR